MIRVPYYLRVLYILHSKSLIPIQSITEPFIEAVPQVVILLCIWFLSGSEISGYYSISNGKSRILLIISQSYVIS